MWYHVEGPVNFASSEGLIGTSNQSYGGQCNLVTNSATTHVLSAVGTSGAYLSGVTWANLAIFRSTAGTGTSAGFYSSFNGGGIVTNTRSYDSIYDYYRHASPGFGIGYWSYDQAAWLLSENSGTFYGYYDDSADGYAENSINLLHSGTDCSGLGSGATSYGQLITGTAVNDNVTNDVGGQFCSYQQALIYTGSGSGAACSDIHWVNSSADNFVLEAEYVSGCLATQTGSVEISGGWAVGGPQTSSANGAIYILNSSGVSIVHKQIGAHQGSGHPATYGVNIAGGGNNTVANNTFMAQNYAVSLTNNTTGNVVTGNTDTNATGGTINIGMQINNGSTYNTLIGNNFGGANTISTGIVIASGSNNNTYVGNNCGSNVTTCVNDSGTGNGVGPLTVTDLAAAGNAFQATTSYTTGASATGFQARGANGYQGWCNATPSCAYSFGYVVPGGASPGTNFLFSVYGGSAWAQAYSINSSTLATTFAGAVNTPSLLATGIVDGTTPITTTTTTPVTLGGTYHSGYTFNNDGATAVTYTLPTAAAGLQYCVANYTGATGTLKVATSATGQFIDNAGANTATGGYVISGGALGDAGCFIGMDATHWKLYIQAGTWTTH
jgi:hypothetical protein